ncbi:MAG TPA: xylulokinase [Phycisphaerae bacterium]|nr:xylulokinase [Phycisphaerae bacterium]
MAYYLGIDVGTSGTKALVTDARARVLATATAEYGVSAPRPGWSEQDPEDWWAGTVKAVRAAVKKAGIDGRQVVGIGLSGQMHGLVITDGAGRPLRPSLIWNDQRTAPQAAEIERTVGGKSKLISLVGNVAMTSFTLTKLLWVRQHEPRIYARIKHLLLPKDYVRLRMTGEYMGEVSDMSGTLLLDQRKRNWSSKMLSIFQIDRSILPPVVESHEVTGRVTKSAAAKLGVAEGAPVVGGGGDQPAGAVGNGIVTDGLTSATMGTSGVVYTHSRQYKTDPQGRVQTFCSSVDGEWCMFGCVMAAGGSFQWYRNVLGQAEVAAARRKKVDPYELLTAQAEQAPPGCEGLFWLPYLTGERTPHADPCAKGCWIGLHSRTTRNELVRAVLEGATFAMNDAVTILRGRGLKIRQIRLSGGGARSAFWRQLQADVYGTTCATINAEEGPAYGVALLAAVGTGRYKDIREACKAAIKITRTIKPDAKAKRLYARYYEQYRRLYPALKEEFARIARLAH